MLPTLVDNIFSPSILIGSVSSPPALVNSSIPRPFTPIDSSVVVALATL